MEWGGSTGIEERDFAIITFPEVFALVHCPLRRASVVCIGGFGIHGNTWFVSMSGLVGDILLDSAGKCWDD